MKWIIKKWQMLWALVKELEGVKKRKEGEENEDRVVSIEQ